VKLPTWIAYLALIAAGAGRASGDPGRGGGGIFADAPVVVLDPGHGGSNLGSRGAGLDEKRLTLELADRVARRLRAHRVDVRLTRTDDRTLTLRQRVAIANRAAADVFVSIHANASSSRSRRGEIALVLDDVERGAAQWEAADLAARMQRSLRARRGAAGDRGVRQDAHHVLLGATMPAALVEVGFLDHPIEGKELADPVVQEQLAGAIAEAVLDQLAD
jgi:N-acetylmuramoyl-L-alanine amidase